MFGDWRFQTQDFLFAPRLPVRSSERTKPGLPTEARSAKAGSGPPLLEKIEQSFYATNGGPLASPRVECGHDGSPEHWWRIFRRRKRRKAGRRDPGELLSIGKESAGAVSPPWSARRLDHYWTGGRPGVSRHGVFGVIVGTRRYDESPRKSFERFYDNLHRMIPKIISDARSWSANSRDLLLKKPEPRRHHHAVGGGSLRGSPEGRQRHSKRKKKDFGKKRFKKYVENWIEPFWLGSQDHEKRLSRPRTHGRGHAGIEASERSRFPGFALSLQTRPDQCGARRDRGIRKGDYKNETDWIPASTRKPNYAGEKPRRKTKSSRNGKSANG